MTKSQIIKAAKAAAEEGIILYYSYSYDRNGAERLITNFDNDVAKMSDNRLIRLCEQGILIKDWDTYYVNATH